MKKNIRVYEYSNCSTCKKALHFLKKHGVDAEIKAIVEHPPSVDELKKMLEHLGGERKRLFNTSGQLYREMKMNEKLPLLSESEALTLLAAHGKLIKRPFLLTATAGAVGFREEEWERILKRSLKTEGS